MEEYSNSRRPWAKSGRAEWSTLWDVVCSHIVRHSSQFRCVHSIACDNSVAVPLGAPLASHTPYITTLRYQCVSVLFTLEQIIRCEPASVVWCTVDTRTPIGRAAQRETDHLRAV